jgi:hypothetical protein
MKRDGRLWMVGWKEGTIDRLLDHVAYTDTASKFYAVQYMSMEYLQGLVLAF